MLQTQMSSYNNSIRNQGLATQGHLGHSYHKRDNFAKATGESQRLSVGGGTQPGTKYTDAEPPAMRPEKHM